MKRQTKIAFFSVSSVA